MTRPDCAGQTSSEMPHARYSAAINKNVRRNDLMPLMINVPSFFAGSAVIVSCPVQQRDMQSRTVVAFFYIQAILSKQRAPPPA